MRCPFHLHGCPSGGFRFADILDTLPKGEGPDQPLPEALESLVEANRRLAEAIAAREAAEDRVELAAVLRTRFARRDGTYAAFMCGRCGYGPIEHFACADLLLHHGDGSVDNSCPSCGELPQTISGWREWDGQCVGVPLQEAEQSDELLERWRRCHEDVVLSSSAGEATVGRGLRARLNRRWCIVLAQMAACMGRIR